MQYSAGEVAAEPGLASTAAVGPAAAVEPDGADADHRIAACAHELRTPIGGMVALADLLLASDLDPVQKRHAEALKEAADHLLAVTTEILDLARLRHDVAAGGKEPVSLRAFLEGIVAPMAARGSARDVGVRLELDPDLPGRIVADRVQLRRMIDNLLDNALKVTSVGEIVVTARLGDAGGLHLTVADTGPGLGPDPGRLFRPFVQGASARGGVGLGLSLVAASVTAMGGRLIAADQPQGGALVGFEVPIEPCAEAEDPCDESAEGLRVLVVEDNAANRIVLKSVIQEFGHRCRIVGRAGAAIEAVQHGEADLVLMDSLLPGLSGADAIRSIRALDGEAGLVPIIAMTASDNPRDLLALRTAGADAVLRKPLSVRGLWEAMQDLLQPQMTAVG